MEWGYTCSSESFGAGDLVDLAKTAEARGFKFVSVSDHYHPWTTRQGQSPYVWSTVGAIAAQTRSVLIGTGVTCPLIRQHPAIVAQAAATCADLSSGRFFLGVGTGEALNEHITGVRWPPIHIRREMLVEAVGVIKALWEGDTVDHRGTYFEVENARLFSAPATHPSVVWAASGEASAKMGSSCADGLWVTSPNPDVIGAFQTGSGDAMVIGELTICWGDPESARQVAYESWPNAAIPGQLTQDLPTWTHFEQAASVLSIDQVNERIIAGNDVDRVVEAAREFEMAGCTHLHLHQVGPDQRSLFDAWDGALGQALRTL